MLRKIIGLWVWGSALLYAQPSISIQALLQESLAYNPKIKAERAQFEAAKQEFRAQSRLYFPNVSIDASYGVQRSKTSTLPYDTYPEENYGVTLTQDLYTGGKFSAQIERSFLQFNHALAGFYEVRNNAAAEFLDLYTQLYNNLEAQKLNEKNIAVLKHSMQQLSEMVKNGEAIPNDIIQAEARLALEQAEKHKILAEYTALAQKFKNMVGHLPPMTLNDPRDFCDLQEEKSYILTHIEAHNPALKKAELAVKIAAQDIDIADSHNAPSLSLVARSDYTEGQSAFFRNQARTSSATLRLQFPIFNKGMSYPMVKKAQSLKQAAQAQLEHVSNNIHSQFEQDYAMFQALNLVINASEKAVTSVQKHLGQIKSEHILGFKTYYDVLEVQRDVMRAQKELLDHHMQKASLGCKIVAMQGKLLQG